MADRRTGAIGTGGHVARAFLHLLRDSFGGIGMSFAVSLPVVLAILGAASDYAVLTKLRAEIQEVADAAAMAGAREIPLANSDLKQIENAARMFAVYRLTGTAGLSSSELQARKLTIDVAVEEDLSSVDVRIREDWSPFFAHMVSKTVTPIRVSASARFVGRTNICVLGTAKTNTAVLLDKNARLTGNDCGVFSNASDSSGLRVNTGASMTASMICSAGGVEQNGASLKPSPLTDCPAVDDPLASRQGPAIGGCDHMDLVLTNVTQTIDPGVYCGGLKIAGNSTVTLNPGVYVMLNGGLLVAGTSTLQGEGVGFYVSGAASLVHFTPKTHISLSAPTEGPLAGLLIFEDRTLSTSFKHRISSDDARKLIGTIYLPVGQLVIDAKQPVADQSAYTAIIATRLELNMGPNLILNSDYAATDVPVPTGIAGSSQVVLTK